MGTVQVCLGRKASSRPISPRTQIAPAKETPRDLAAVPERATSPAKVVWESRRENTSRDSRKGDRVNGSTKTRGSVRAHIKDSGGNTVLLSVASQVLKDYEVKALIGQGSFSRVLCIEKRTTKKLFALKVIEKEQPEGSRYMTELHILEKIRHPNIISLSEVFHTNRKVYLVMELALGGDLFERVHKQGYFAETAGQRIISMVLSGVAYLHGLGITHRDLKLENILFRNREAGDNSEIVVSDFGLAHMRSGSSDNDTMSTTCGSAEYLAPEILQGEGYTELIDMWAVGVITYIVLSRRMPFMDESRARLYQKITKGQFSFTEEPWSNVSLAGKDFICKLLCVDTAHRLCARDALDHHWFADSRLEQLT